MPNKPSLLDVGGQSTFGSSILILVHLLVPPGRRALQHQHRRIARVVCIDPSRLVTEVQHQDPILQLLLLVHLDLLACLLAAHGFCGLQGVRIGIFHHRHRTVRRVWPHAIHPRHEDTLVDLFQVDAQLRFRADSTACRLPTFISIGAARGLAGFLQATLCSIDARLQFGPAPRPNTLLPLQLPLLAQHLGFHLTSPCAEPGSRAYESSILQAEPGNGGPHALVDAEECNPERAVVFEVLYGSVLHIQAHADDIALLEHPLDLVLAIVLQMQTGLADKHGRVGERRQAGLFLPKRLGLAFFLLLPLRSSRGGTAT
mmetsp:Transcript_4922/g.11805  ORF Transcript_4922/g.11805 Transcript_4922/m.11805 type:complete len:315 (-) Transcript_4922:2790-3734(-)